MNRLLVCGLALTLVACGDSAVATGPDTQQPQTDVYTLTEFAGQSLPAHFTNGSQTGIVTAGALLLNADMSYSVTQTGYTSQTIGGVTVNSQTATDTIEAGTYDVTGTKIVFTASVNAPGGGTAYTHQGSISGSYVSYTDASGTLYVYQIL